MRVATVAALADALGVRLRIAADLPHRVGRVDQNDRVHARACAYIGRRLTERGWEIRQEVEVGRDTVRGWIDTLGYRKADGALFVSEFKSEQRDAGAVQRTMGWYEREAWAAARALGWRPTVVGSAVLLLASEANDEAVRANRDLLAQACPTRASELGRWLDQPTGRPMRRALAMIDPFSRRRQWLRPTRTDGRRSTAPWVGYADCAQAIAIGRRSMRRPS